MAPGARLEYLWCRWCSGSARRFPPWSAPRSVLGVTTARLKLRGLAPRWRAASLNSSGSRRRISDRVAVAVGNEPTMLGVGASYLHIVGPL